ncbi:hypothetical protein H0H93_005236, partial [Arthromyces matolae]
PAAAAHAASATPSSTTTYFSAASDNVDEVEDVSSVVSAPAQSETEAEHEPESPSTLDDSEETTTKHSSSIINPSSSPPPHNTLPPPQPNPNANPNRLSFISYADLLSSTPTSTIPLSHLTTAASISEPPPHVHIPNLVQSTFSYPPSPISGPSPTSAAPSLRGFPLALSPPIPVFNPNSNLGGGGGGGVSPIHSTTSSPNRPTSFYNNASGNGNGNGSPKRRIASLNAGLDPATAAAVAATGGGGGGGGGEWEREGLGSGLVERLAYV